MPAVAVEGIHLWVEPDGPIDAPLVVFLHGALAVGAAFRSQSVALRDRYRLAFVDQRGHGRATRLGRTHDGTYDGHVSWETLTHAQLVRDAAALIDALSPDRPVHLVGASMGGLVAAKLAAARPERVASLALLSTSGFATEKRRRYFADLTPETLPRGTQLLSAKWHGEPYWRDLARHLFAGIVAQTIEVYPDRLRVPRALVMQSIHDEILDPREAQAWVDRIDGDVTLGRPPGDHAFFADGRSGSQAANAALRAHLLGA
jgi:pimeloyl-ACP methyl ester carboxylesterase